MEPVIQDITIAVLLDNPFINDRRVSRELSALAECGYSIYLFAVKSDRLPDREDKNGYTVLRIFGDDIYDPKKQSSLRKYHPLILQVKPDVLHCHDQTMLFLGSALKRRFPGLFLVYDSHELFHAWPLNLSRYGDPWLYLKSWVVRKYLVHRERRSARNIDRLITVNRSLAENLERYFRLRTKPAVVRNLPEKRDYIRDKSLLRKKYSLPDSTSILVFIGSAIYPRTLNLEQVIRETAGLEDFAFIIICGEQGGKKDVMNWVDRNGFKHVYFHPLLKPDEIGPVLASCDAGLVPTWNKKDLSYWFALDNKLFEYMMSGIPVLATRQPEYRAVVEPFDIGVCVDPDHPGGYRQGLLTLLREKESYKEPIEHARSVLNWDNEKKVLLEIYSQMITR
jgi:glycosyltransferase involved in cell wall biosynthesis